MKTQSQSQEFKNRYFLRNPKNGATASVNFYHVWEAAAAAWEAGNILREQNKKTNAAHELEILRPDMTPDFKVTITSGGEINAEVYQEQPERRNPYQPEGKPAPRSAQNAALTTWAAGDIEKGEAAARILHGALNSFGLTAQEI